MIHSLTNMRNITIEPNISITKINNKIHNIDQSIILLYFNITKAIADNQLKPYKIYKKFLNIISLFNVKFIQEIKNFAKKEL